MDPVPREWIAGSELFAQAESLAADAHRGQRRATDEALFLEHVVEVGALLHDAGYDEQTVAAGILHDSVERGTLTEAELRAVMGDEISALVLALTEDARIQSFAERKRALREQVRAAGTRATTIFAADKLSDIRGLRRGIREHPEHIADRMGTSVNGMADHYEESVAMIEASELDSDFVETLRDELERLAALALPAR